MPAKMMKLRTTLLIKNKIKKKRKRFVEKSKIETNFFF